MKIKEPSKLAQEIPTWTDMAALHEVATNSAIEPYTECAQIAACLRFLELKPGDNEVQQALNALYANEGG